MFFGPINAASHSTSRRREADLGSDKLMNASASTGSRERFIKPITSIFYVSALSRLSGPDTLQTCAALME
jgi:hypothetical protein